MKTIFRTALVAIGLILCISANGQETATRGTIQETGGNIVVHLETASWGQGYPFNEQCWTSYGGTTHAKTGCVSTAYAIVMRYHKFPKEGTANKLYNCQAPTYVELTDRVYDWDNMPLVYDGNWTEAQIYEVSKIMSHLAHANFSSFGSGTTTANEERETARLNRYFNYPKIAASYQRDYTKEQWDTVNDGLMSIFAEFSACKNRGASPDSPEAQALVTKLQAHITEHYYTCTPEILAGLGKMYVADERFKKNIDKYSEGTAEFVSEGIRIYVEKK
jgi:hypothetical protein